MGFEDVVRWRHRPRVSLSKQIIINLQQVNAADVLYDMPLEIQVLEAGTNKPINLKFTINKKSKQYKIHVLKKPALVVADPQSSLLADIDIKENSKIGEGF